MFLVVVAAGVFLIGIFVLFVYLYAKSRKPRPRSDEAKQATKW